MKLRKTYPLAAASLLAGVAVLTGLGPAHAATGPAAKAAAAAPVSQTRKLACTIPGTDFTFAYQVHMIWVGNRVSVRDVTVTDAKGGHTMEYMLVEVAQGGTDFTTNAATWDPIDAPQAAKMLLYAPYRTATKANPVKVTLTLRAYTNNGGITPICWTRPAFWG